MQVDFSKVKDFARKGLDKARQYAEGLNELEVKVEEATNSDKWGPHGSLMQEITKRSFVLEDYKQILAILARRLHSEPNQWRHVYKALLLLEYMAKNGPERMVSELKSNGRVFAKLQQFQYTDSKNKDQGINVRNRSKQLWELVNDADAVAAEREKAAKNKNKYTGADRFGIAPGQSTSHSPAPSFGSTDASVTRPAASGGDGAAPLGGGASGGEDDAVAATERRVQQLSVGGSDAGGAASPRAGNARPKPKLSSIAVDNSIAATFQNFPVQDPPAGAPVTVKPPVATDAGSNGALNLLDFDDDPPAAATPPPAAANGAAAAAADEDDWADFSGAAAAQPSTPDPFGGDALVGTAPAVSVPDDPFSSVAPVAPPPSLGATAAAASSAPAASVQASGRQPLPLDAFAEPVPAIAPLATGAASPALATAPAPPTASGLAPPAHAASVEAVFDPFAGAAAAASNGTGGAPGGAALKGGALKDEKDPFADLF